MATPDRVGPYRISSRLGAGGMGEVFLAEDTRLHRRVALKKLGEKWAGDADSRRYLIHEARAAAALNHPNIAAVYDVLDTENAAFIVMEYVPGDSLAQRLRAGPLQLHAVLRIGVQLCQALAVAHQQGILHRDLTPANLLLTPQGQLKVLDFGLAKSFVSVRTEDGGDIDVSDHGKIAGTPAYIPPERYEGAASDERQDIYSTGVVLYELLSGIRPFSGADVASLARAVLDGQPKPLRSVAPLVPEPVAATVHQAMARRPAERHPSAAALGAELEKLEVLSEQKTEGVVTTLRARRRHPWRWVAAALAAAAVVATAAVQKSRRPGSEASRAPAVPVVMVLPLSNATGNPADEALGTGVADVVISALWRVPQVNVLSLATSNECAGARRNLACAASLGATYVLDGSVQRQADRVRVILNLANATSRIVLWSDSYDGALEDLFGFQQTLAEGVAGALRLRVPREAAGAERLAVGERSFGDYAEALLLLERRDERASVDRAITLLEAVTAQEPRFALAQASLGRAHWIKYELTKDVDQTRRAEAALRSALELDSELPGVLLVQATILRAKGQLAAAESVTRRALAARPESDEVHALLGDVLVAQGRKDEGVAELNRAIELRPSYWQHHNTLAMAEYGRGRLDAAAASWRRVVELRPDSPMGYVSLGAALYGLGDRAGARAQFERAAALGDADAHSNLGFFAYEEKRYADAADAFGRAAALLPKDPGLQRNLGDALARLGRAAEARGAYAVAVELQKGHVRAKPNSAPTVARLAVYEAKAGDPESARRRAAAALEMAPESAEVAYFAAVAFALSGQQDAGAKALERAIRLGYNREVLRTDEDLAGLRAAIKFEKLTAASANPNSERGTR
jgi:serine/threonine-protein kinase